MKKKELAYITVSFVCISIIIGMVLIIMYNNNNNSPFTRNEKKTLNSLKKIDDHPLFLMHFYGDYGFEQYLTTGLANNKVGLQIHKMTEDHSSIISINANWACTCFAALNSSSDSILYGRNFDWSNSPKMLLYTSSLSGYSSVTMVDLGMLGFSSEFEVLNASPTKLRDLLNAPYWTLDGMNEKGLAVACMAVPYAENIITQTKITLSSLTFMRLVIDFAQNVEEALSLWAQFNVDFTGGPPLHYLISDALGNSAVVEFINGEMKVLRNQIPWQVSTNFIIYNSTPAIQNSCWRYRTVTEELNSTKGMLSQTEAMQLLEDVSQSITEWSIVYNLNTFEILLVVGKKYTQTHSYNLLTDFLSAK